MADEVRLRNVLITGTTGFIGSHLVHKVFELGWTVSVLVRKSSDVRKLEPFQSRLSILNHDGSTEQLIDFMTEQKPEVVFHLASHVIGEHEPRDVESLIQSNVLFGTQVLEAMHVAKIENFVNTGTFWQYYRNDRYSPTNLYAATKQAFADILRFYVEARSIRALTLVLFDVYGPSDTRLKLFPMLESASKNGQLLSMTPGRQKVDLVYIDDVLRAYVRAADLLCSSHIKQTGQSYAVSSGKPMSLRKAVMAYEQVTGRKLRVQWGSVPYRARQVMRPWKGEPLPGWQPRISLEEGIRLLMAQEKTDVRTVKYQAAG